MVDMRAPVLLGKGLPASHAEPPLTNNERVFDLDVLAPSPGGGLPLCPAASGADGHAAVTPGHIPTAGWAGPARVQDRRARLWRYGWRWFAFEQGGRFTEPLADYAVRVGVSHGGVLTKRSRRYKIFSGQYLAQLALRIG